MARRFALLVSTLVVLALSVAVAHAQHLGHAPPVDDAWRTFLAQMIWPTALIVGILARVSSRGTGTRPLPSPQARAWMNVDLTGLRLAIDVASREFLERELRAIAPTGAPPARDPIEALRRIVRTLRKCDVAWTHGGSSNFHPMSPPVAEAGFKRLVREARDKSERAAMPTASSSAEPQFVLLTLVVAARREVRDFFGGRREEIHALLDDLERLTPSELVSFEIVWAPRDAGASMSRAALEASDPDLAVLVPVGRIEPRRSSVAHCAYCKGPFARTLPTCSHCGAPAPHEALDR